eukprot:CAMPEP_0113853190 /NCGR_PEP_ID=MMETSP0372-20130328/6159_1 /TAXON_ID=340204 /ORGANISM="Lankesteria abbotti" /LENGTH=174 /DNA_ID=CAMNT_0000825285 /DNA_START=44 /DNA_END=564 /DNA_ORIENTATION=+ /assembly_acc=CAM_ASM_000359
MTNNYNNDKQLQQQTITTTHSTQITRTLLQLSCIYQWKTLFLSKTSGSGKNKNDVHTCILYQESIQYCCIYQVSISENDAIQQTEIGDKQIHRLLSQRKGMSEHGAIWKAFRPCIVIDIVVDVDIVDVDVVVDVVVDVDVVIDVMIYIDVMIDIVAVSQVVFNEAVSAISQHTA